MRLLVRIALLAGVVLIVCGALFFFGVIPGWHRSHGEAVARVNGKDITRADLERTYKQQLAGTPQQLDVAQANAVKLGILQKLIETEILMQQAEKLGVLATDDEVNEKMTQQHAPFTAEEFQKRLKEEGITEDEMRRQIRIELTGQKVLNKEVNSKITITDGDLAAYYNSHKAEFNLIEPVYQVARILVAVGGEADLPNQKPNTPAEAQEKIRMIFNRLQSGEDFESLASKYSEDLQTKNSGGLLGALPESDLQRVNPASREALLKMKTGQISGIIALPDPRTRQLAAYEVLKLLAREPAGQRQLSDPAVQQWIRSQLRNSREALLRAAFFETVRNRARIENYFAEEVLRSNASK